MRKNIPLITLTYKNLKDIKPEDVIAVTVASNGAMGDPGAVEIVDKSLDVYYTRLGEIDVERLEKIVPFIKEFDVLFTNLWTGKKTAVGEEWVGIYTGYGNCLFVRPKLKQPILDYIKANYKESSPTIELYAHWYDALKEIMKKGMEI